MGAQQEVSQRDLRLRSREIMDAVEHGMSVTVTRGGRSIGELTPIHRAPRFLSREEFVRLGSGLTPIDIGQFRRDLDGVVDGDLAAPYDR